MAVPWLQIVQLVPSIVDVSRELLRRTKRLPAAPEAMAVPESEDEFVQRILQLEENERRQAELINEMAQQVANLSSAVTALHRQILWLSGIGAIAIIAALVAIGIAVTK